MPATCRRPIGRAVVTAVLAVLTAVPAAQPVAADQPTGAEVGNSDWQQVRAAGSHTCGIRTSGRLYCWGVDGSGQLGNGGTNTNVARPSQVAGGATNWTAVTLGNGHTCGLRATGRLYCWGSDLSGQLGTSGPNTDRITPTQVAGGATNWTAVTAGNNQTCGLRATGRLYCWGSDSSGQLGTSGPNTNRATPTQVSGGATNWTSVDAGQFHTCARRSTGRLYCWGDDGTGQLGDGGANNDRITPTQVAGGTTDWTSVTAGGNHTCARRSTGRLYCWGRDTFGQLGDGGPNTNRPTPELVDGDATDWTSVFAGAQHTCGHRSTGRLYCWGWDISGQLGDGGTNTDRVIPTQVAGGATDWTSVTGGHDHTCARIIPGRLFCWGSNGGGQLGDNTTTDSPVPIPVHA